MFMMYCGSSLHGGVVRESHRQRDGILISNFFITYFLSTKPEELPEEGEEEAGENSSSQTTSDPEQLASNNSGRQHFS